jgi:hypothetical protein
MQKGDNQYNSPYQNRIKASSRHSQENPGTPGSPQKQKWHERWQEQKSQYQDRVNQA